MPTNSENIHDAVGDARLLILRHTLRDPHDVPDLLLPEPYVRVKHLHHERVQSGFKLRMYEPNQSSV